MSPQPSPRPSSPPPAPPRPAGPAQPPRPVGPKVPSLRLVDDTWFRIGVIADAVGALLLVTNYFEPFLLLGALPTKQWRAAA